MTKAYSPFQEESPATVDSILNGNPCGSCDHGSFWREIDPFPVVLHRMLGEMENEGNEHIISWNDDGKSFAIHDPKVFAEKILTRYFQNQTRYKSFQRQLNLYRFNRIMHGDAKRVYSHSSFLRDSPHLCQFVRRSRKQPRREIMGKQQESAIHERSDSSRKLFQKSLPVNFNLTHSANGALSSTGGSQEIAKTRLATRSSTSQQDRWDAVVQYPDVELLTASLSCLCSAEGLDKTVASYKCSPGGESKERIDSRLDPRRSVDSNDHNNNHTMGSVDQDDDSIGSIDFDEMIVPSVAVSGNLDERLSWACHPVDGEIFP